MLATIFPLTRYQTASDEYLTRYYEILHTIGMTIHTMANDVGSLGFPEKHLNLTVPLQEQARQGRRSDGNARKYRQSLQTSEELLPSDQTIWPWEKVALRACSFTLLLCLLEDYTRTSQMLDHVFMDDTWTYFAEKRGIKSRLVAMSRPVVYRLLRQTCVTLPDHVHPQTWIHANVANWVEVCSKNLSSFLQTNSVPGGAFEGSQRYLCLVSTGETLRRYVGSIHILSKERNPAYLVMGILKHPIAEKTCNRVDRYIGFVRTALDGVRRFMEIQNKFIMWTFPLERMAVILRGLYGPISGNKRLLVTTFLRDIGMSSVERQMILGHPSGIFVYEHRRIVDVEERKSTLHEQSRIEDVQERKKTGPELYRSRECGETPNTMCERCRSMWAEEHHS